MTKATTRRFFFLGTVLFTLAFIGLTVHTHTTIAGRTNEDRLTEDVRRGGRVWAKYNCENCHTLLGEGAYFAPELGNVYPRRGPDFIKAWIKSQPTGAPGRRQMPQFNLTDQELDDLVAFLKYTSEINAQKWPPNIEG